MRITNKTTKPVSYFVKVAESKGLKLERLMEQKAPSGIIADAFVEFNSILHNLDKGKGSIFEQIRGRFCKSDVHKRATEYLQELGYIFYKNDSRLTAPTAKDIAMLKANPRLDLTKRLTNFDAIIAKKGKPRTFRDFSNLLKAADVKGKEWSTLTAQKASSDQIGKAWAELESAWRKING